MSCLGFIVGLKKKKIPLVVSAHNDLTRVTPDVPKLFNGQYDAGCARTVQRAV